MFVNGGGIAESSACARLIAFLRQDEGARA
jgi:hypothetical protein